MKWLLIGVAILVGIIVLVVAIGALLPQGHVATRQARLNATPDAVWKLITDIEAFPSWRRDVRRVERLPDRESRPVWAEDTTSGRITLAIDSAEPPRRLVARIADPDLPFGGTWTYELQPDGNGTVLTITENGEVYNPIFRFMARFVFGHEATLAAYIDALRHKTAATEPSHGL